LIVPRLRGAYTDLMKKTGEAEGLPVTEQANPSRGGDAKPPVHVMDSGATEEPGVSSCLDTLFSFSLV
jgi:hypothetical protein